MDAERYARVRELFLAAEELPAEQQEPFLQLQADGDEQLLSDVMSLLAEHDPESARLEGERTIPLQTPGGRTLAGKPGRKFDTQEQTTRSGRRDDSAVPTRQGQPRRSSEITHQGALQTHASPRDSSSRAGHSSATASLWAKRDRQRRRATSGWLWLAALLPTAIVGWFTIAKVGQTINESLRSELSRVADTLTLATGQFLRDKAQLVQSWSRQSEIQQACVELVRLADQLPSDREAREQALQELRQAPQAEQIRAQLQSLSAVEEIKFVVWNDANVIVASWSGTDVGARVHPTGAGNLARVLRGQTVVFGPERLIHNSDGFAPETDRPVMGVIVPIVDRQERVIASLLVRGFGLYDELNRMFSDANADRGLDAYAVNRDGVMVTESPHAMSLARQGLLDSAPDALAANFRVADPGAPLDAFNIQELQREICPLTKSAAGAIAGREQVQIDPYSNYAGESVVGAWRLSAQHRLGVVIEQPAAVAFAPLRIVLYSFLTLGSLLTVTALAVATKIARTSAREHAAVHPLSRYEVIRELGGGGMGVVYQARHRQLGRETALKLLRADRQSKEDRLRFDREARVAASLSSPHSVMIYDYGYSQEGEAFCVMELLQGLTLNEVVTRGGHQPIGRVLGILSQICDALSEAHASQLLHRDIKPQNVMLSLDASVGDWAVVFDYGLAKPLQPDAGVYQTAETIWAGTPMYMAPERFRDPGTQDPRSDLYSVGCVAYYLLSGRPPFIECDPESLFALILTEQPISIATHRDEVVPEEISQMVLRCMAKSVDERYASVDELGAVISELRKSYPWSVEDARTWWRTYGADD